MTVVLQKMASVFSADDVKILFDFWQKDGASMNEQLGRTPPAEVGYGLKRDGVPLKDAYGAGRGKL